MNDHVNYDIFATQKNKAKMACFGSLTNCSKSYTALFWTQKIVLVSKKWVFVTGPICNRIWSQKWTANVENRYGPLIHAMRHIASDMLDTNLNRK